VKLGNRDKGFSHQFPSVRIILWQPRSMQIAG
jgi:hypothetical protein